MLKIIWDSMDGDVMPEGRVADYAVKVIGQYRMGNLFHAVVGSELLINEFRLAVKEGRLKTEEISFIFEGRPLTHTADGRFTEWPLGFCDVHSNQLERILSPY